MKNKVKIIDLGKYPSIDILNKYRSQCDNLCKGMQDDMYIYFNTSKGMRRRKLFN